jgi:hypothetical protein
METSAMDSWLETLVFAVPSLRLAVNRVAQKGKMPLKIMK